MNDPLGLINSANAPVGPIKAPSGRTSAGGVKQDPEAPGFRDLLMENLKTVNKLQQDATHAIEDLQTGKRDDLETVMMATAKADNAFRMLLQVRNKVIAAYDEIKQIRV
jgi:flagellar hook-basal body complex protein FliE